jgi:hypothetical protein
MGDHNKPALEPYADATIKAFRARGIDPTIDECIRLNDAARLLSVSARDVSTRGIPIPVGETIWLWPTTVQADRWYGRAVRWFDGDELLQTLALAFSMAHAREPGAFELIMDDPQRAQMAVEKWANLCTATYNELVAGMARVIDQAAPVDPAPAEATERSADASYSGLVAIISERSGIPPDYWETHVSRDYLLYHISAVCSQGGAKGQALDASHPIVIANKAVAVVEMDIERAHKQEPQAATV